MIIDILKKYICPAPLHYSCKTSSWTVPGVFHVTEFDSDHNHCTRPSRLWDMDDVSSSPQYSFPLTAWLLHCCQAWSMLTLCARWTCSSRALAKPRLDLPDDEIWMMSPHPSNIRFPWLLDFCTVVRHDSCSQRARDEHVQVAHIRNAWEVV